jgi:hypothetical protein
MMGVVQSPGTSIPIVIGKSRSEHLVQHQADRAPDPLEAIQADFPGHHIWLSRTGSMWMASLRDPSCGVDPTLAENSPERLRTRLEQEAEAARRRP